MPIKDPGFWREQARNIKAIFQPALDVLKAVRSREKHRKRGQAARKGRRRGR